MTVEEATATAHEMSVRQREILGLIGRGHARTAVAAQLGISRSTVNVLCFRIGRYYGLHGDAALARFAIQAGLSPLEG